MTPEDFVALSFAHPLESDRAKFGYAMRAASDNPNPPGCIALTWIAGKDEAERERIRAHAKRNVQDFLEEPGFLSIVTGFIGHLVRVSRRRERRPPPLRSLRVRAAAAPRLLVIRPARRQPDSRCIGGLPD